MIPNLINEGNGYRMIENDQDNADAMANCLGVVSTKEPPPDEDLGQETKQTVCSPRTLIKTMYVRFLRLRHGKVDRTG